MLHQILSGYLKTQEKGILEFIRNPLNTQQSIFNELIAQLANTEYGKKFGISSNFSLAEFKNALPIVEYDDLQPYIKQMIEGKKRVLWPEQVDWFAKSSGTTSHASKYIPISDRNLKNCHFKAGKDIMAIYLANHPKSKIFKGKGLVVGGSHQVSKLGKQSYYGDLSAVLMQNMSFWMQFFRSPKLSVALMDNWEEKLERMANDTINDNITSLAGVPTWTLKLLERILQKTKANSIAEVWPNLELYIHGGVSFKPYRALFDKIIGKPIAYKDAYNASEGYFAIQNNPNDDSLLLMLDYGIFYEFMPMSEFGKADPQTIGLDKVELDTNYALVISTNSGLWRYMVGDTIQFSSLSPFKIRVSGRTKHFINVFGEEVIIDNTDNALQLVCQKHQVAVRDYTVAPIYFEARSKAGHEWAIEFIDQTPNLTEFAKDLDKELQSINTDYAAKRAANIALKELSINVLPHGSFNVWLSEKGKLGGQHKIPRLFNERTYLEEVIKASKKVKP